MKYIILVSLTILAQSAFSLNAKDILGIKDLDLDSLNVSELISSSSIVTNSPTTCSAVTYILYGSSKEKSTLPEAKLFEYTDRKVSEKTLLQSKKFLMETSVLHTNKSTRAMASMTIAFSFPDDDEIAQWLSDHYFSDDVSSESRSALLGTIRVGKFTNYQTDLVVKAGLMSMSADQVVNAASCVKSNPNHYKPLLPDLILSLLTLDPRNKSIDAFDSRVDISVSYLLLTQATQEYLSSAKQYFGLLTKLAETSDNKSVQLLVMKMNANK